MSINLEGSALPAPTNVFPDPVSIAFQVGSHQVVASSFINTDVTASLAALPLASLDVSANQSVNATTTLEQLSLTGLTATIIGDTGLVNVNVTASTAVLPLTSSSATVVEFGVSTVPPLSAVVGGSIDMSQYVHDPAGVRTSLNVTGLSGFGSYNPSTELLTGDSLGSETGLTLVVSDD